MTIVSAKHAILVPWLALGLVWLVGSFGAKRTVRRQAPILRAAQVVLGLSAVVIGFTRYFEFGWFMHSLIPSTRAMQWIGVLLVWAGAAFAVWARITLGRNWSADVTLKQEHELIRRGPYALVRHPIYSGMLLAILGTVVVYGEVRGFVALGMLLVMLLLKIRIEERFMAEQFGGGYLEYRRHTKRLVPLIW